MNVCMCEEVRRGQRRDVYLSIYLHIKVTGGLDGGEGRVRESKNKEREEAKCGRREQKKKKKLKLRCLSFLFDTIVSKIHCELRLPM